MRPRIAVPSPGGRRQRELRWRVAVEAARLISEHGIRDYQQAKRKAAERLNALDEASLPKNREIEDALREHQRLFDGHTHDSHLQRLREAAVHAMDFLSWFEPRLVGAVLDGTADRHSAVCLHLFCDTPEQVLVFLDEHAIAYGESTRRLRFSSEQQYEYPVVQVNNEDAAFDLTLLPRDSIRQAPLDRISSRPMQRATLAALQELIAADDLDQRLSIPT